MFVRCGSLKGLVLLLLTGKGAVLNSFGLKTLITVWIAASRGKVGFFLAGGGGRARGLRGTAAYLWK